MPRYKPPKITRAEAARELTDAYNKGHATGSTGVRPQPDGPWSTISYMSGWDFILRERENEGQRDGYASFCRRVREVKCSELPPPVVGPPPKITFDPGYMNGRG